MTMIDLKGLHLVKAKGRTYIYAWRGGPRVKGTPGTPQFQAAYVEAVETHRVPDKKAFKSVVVRYRASPDYQKLAPSTQKNWGPWLDRIADYFGKLQTRQFDRSDKIRPIIRKWRAKYAETPRTADYGMQVLSRVLAFAVDQLGELGTNPCEGIKQIYTNDRSAIIWAEDDIARVKEHCSAEVAFAVDLAAHTGLRSGDLVKVCWSHIQHNAIIIRTGKSRGKKEAIVPLYDDLRALLARIPKRSTQILTNSFGKPWHKDGLGSRFVEAKNKAWKDGTELNFHDLRGTAATKFYLAGFSTREIAEMMGWEEDSVEKIIRRYVTRTAAIEEKIRRLNATKPA